MVVIVQATHAEENCCDERAGAEGSRWHVDIRIRIESKPFASTFEAKCVMVEPEENEHSVFFNWVQLLKVQDRFE